MADVFRLVSGVGIVSRWVAGGRKNRGGCNTVVFAMYTLRRKRQV